MIFKTTVKLMGIKMTPEQLKKLIMGEAWLLAFLLLLFVVLRYATGTLSHELFVELMLIFMWGSAIDMYFAFAALAGRK